MCNYLSNVVTCFNVAFCTLWQKTLLYVTPKLPVLNHVCVCVLACVHACLYLDLNRKVVIGQLMVCKRKFLYIYVISRLTDSEFLLERIVFMNAKYADFFFFFGKSYHPLILNRFSKLHHELSDRIIRSTFPHNVFTLVCVDNPEYKTTTQVYTKPLPVAAQ